LGQLALYQGDTATASSLAEESVVLFRELENRQDLGWGLSFLASVVAAQGNYAAAQAFYEESLALRREVGHKGDIASGLEGLAHVLMMQGQHTWAVQLWGAAEVLREATGSPLPPIESAGYERDVASARAHLGKKAFAAAWAEGRTMSPEQALAAQGREMASRIGPAGQLTTPPAKSRPTYPDGLTAREVEVLRLVAQGLTDTQVAEQLVLSRRTVNSYLTSIYSKIQVSSRSAATRYAIEHRLA
jgi:DNA-binding CsgD family transcriptional regulator